VDRKANVTCRVRIEAKRRSVDRNLHPIQHTKSGQLQAHEIVDTRSAPMIGDEKIEGITERSKAAREPRLEIHFGGGLMHGLARDRLNDGDQILDAMAESVMTRNWAFSSLAATLPASATSLKEGRERMLASFASLIGISPLLQWRGAVGWSRNASHGTLVLIWP
jgi:hypothetical protein